ncbi:uncharacterized protein LOC132559021 [Ylistrum balloti]|uniref:uncharacterized protein LOC132559021 n=1 Tax=Ylistrum balloti TaxID=509963 RepID=UPI002905810F|nr:uncharacterized protein LOC132559021 [Ylistrum balloti]
MTAFQGMQSRQDMNTKRPKRKNKKRELQLPSVFINNSWSSDEYSEEPEIFGQNTILSVQSPIRCSKISPRQLNERMHFWRNVKSGKHRFQKGVRKYGNISENGIYSDSVDKLYKLVTRENSVMLPPLQTSGRIKSNISNYIDMAEKKYVMKDFKTEGRISKFARDEVYFPSVNKDLFTCYECRRRYVSDMFTEAFAARNSKKPQCVAINAPNSKKHKKAFVKSRGTRAQFCDVLGKRFCSECGESENRRMGQTILDTYRPERKNDESLRHMTPRKSLNRKYVIIDPIPTVVTYDES